VPEFAQRTGVALITGGSGGVGAAVARRFVSEGSRVALTYHKTEPLDLLAELGAAAQAYRLDVSDATAVADTVHHVVEQHGMIHTLVHAAGPHVPMIHLSKVTPAQFAQQVDADLNGYFNVMHAVIPALREAQAAVVVITTAATQRYPVRDGLSAAPKGGVEALARAFAAEEGRFGIRINCVGPGMLTDGMSARLMASGALDQRALDVAMSNIPLRRFGSTVDIAEAVLFLASDRAQFITGQKLDVDGGYGV